MGGSDLSLPSRVDAVLLTLLLPVFFAPVLVWFDCPDGSEVAATAAAVAASSSPRVNISRDAPDEDDRIPSGGGIKSPAPPTPSEPSFVLLRVSLADPDVSPSLPMTGSCKAGLLLLPSPRYIGFFRRWFDRNTSLQCLYMCGNEAQREREREREREVERQIQ